MTSRRHFLIAFLHSFPLINLHAEILKGRSSKMHGQRDHAIWQAANRLVGVRMAKPGDLNQAAFFIDLNCPACA